MTLFVSSENQYRLSRCQKTCRLLIFSMCLVSLGACKTLGFFPDDAQQENDPQKSLNTIQPWVKKQPGFIQLFATEESKSAADIVELIHYFNHSHKMSPAALKKEVKIAENAYKKEPLPITGLSLAYLYTIKLSLSATKKSEKILVGLIKNNSVHESYRAFSQLLLNSMVAKSDQRRLFLKERGRNKTLKQQLEALKNIELKINERQPTAELAEPAP